MHWRMDSIVSLLASRNNSLFQFQNPRSRQTIEASNLRLELDGDFQIDTDSLPAQLWTRAVKKQ